MASPPRLNLTITPVPRAVRFHSLTEEELEAIYEAGNMKTLDVAMFSLAAGVAISTAVTLMTVDNLSVKASVVLWVLQSVSVLASVFFGVRSVLAYKAAARKLQDFKKQPVSP